MILLYIKFTAATSLLIAFYYLVLERQKNHHFKRYFLLGSLLIAGIIPFLEIPIGTYYVEDKTTGITLTTVNSSIKEVKNMDWLVILSSLYYIVTFILIMKLVYQIFKLFQTKKHAKIIKNKTFDIALLTQKTTAFSFLNTIYLNQNLYENQLIDDSIIIHEKAHIDQNHSYDIILIEIIKALFWLNPALYFYKSAICTNHEFLADDKVLESKSIKNYQKIIYNEITNNFSPLVQTFKRHNNTKKRFIMMNTNPKRSTARILGSVLFSGAIIFAFAEKVKTPILLESKTKLSSPLSNKVLTDTIKNSNADKVDIQAEFPGGMTTLRNALSNEFDISKFDNIYGKLNANSFIIIDKYGKLQGVRTESANEKFRLESNRSIEKVLKNITWIPAQKNGEAVASELKIPFTIEFIGKGETPPPPPPPPALRSKK